RSGMGTTNKTELLRLLTERSLSPFERRRNRMIEAQGRLYGWNKNGLPRCDGIADLLERFRTGQWQSLDEFTEDELMIVSFGDYPELKEKVQRSRLQQEIAGVLN